MSSDKKNSVNAGRKPWLRTTIMGAIWAVAGALTVGYSGALVYANFVRLEVDSAVIAGTLEVLQAPSNGIVVAVGKRPGDALRQGDRLMRVQDPETERQVAMAGVRLERARQELRLRESELASETARRDDYVLIARNELARLRGDIEGLEQQVANARARVERFTTLYTQGFASRQRLEDMTSELAGLNARLARTRIVEQERRALLASTEAGRHYDGTQIVGRLAELRAASARARGEVELAVEELRVWMERREETLVTAATAGRLLRILRPEGNSVRAGDTLMIYERPDDRVVHAFLTQDEVVRVAIGDAATVFIPALRAHVEARVVGIERAAAYLDDVEARYLWRQARDTGTRIGDRDRTARVVLRFDEGDARLVRERTEPGTPSVVSFSRRSINTVLGGFAPLAAAR